MVKAEQSLSTNHETFNSCNVDDRPLKILSNVNEAHNDDSVKVLILLAYFYDSQEKTTNKQSHHDYHHIEADTAWTYLIPEIRLCWSVDNFCESL